MRRSSGRFAQRSFSWAFSGIALCLVAGCAAHTDIAANKDASYTREPQRLMVVESMGSPLGDQTQRFRDRLSHNIDDCHILASYTVAPAYIASPYASPTAPYVKEWLATRDAAIAQFGPDTILGIAETQYTQQTSSGITGFTSSIPQIVYEVTLTDVPTKRAVWKAQVTLHSGVGTDTDLGAKLADDITAKLIQDRIFQNCPAGVGK